MPYVRIDVGHNGPETGEFVGWITHICKLFHLNELEMAYWSLLLDWHRWNTYGLEIGGLLTATACEAKVQTIINSS